MVQYEHTCLVGVVLLALFIQYLYPGGYYTIARCTQIVIGCSYTSTHWEHYVSPRVAKPVARQFPSFLHPLCVPLYCLDLVAMFTYCLPLCPLFV